MSDVVVGDLVAQKLSVHLGPNVARMAVKTFAGKIGASSAEITMANLPQLIDALRPMLVVMIGKEPSEAVLGEIARDCR